MIDLETHRFTQSDVLKMLPSLKAKQLQNWNARGVLEEGNQKPGKAGSRLYSAGGVICLEFMRLIVDFGVPPSEAFKISTELATSAFEFLSSKPETVRIQSGANWIKVTPTIMTSFRRGIIEKSEDGEFSLMVEGDWKMDSGGVTDRISHSFGLFIEVDYLIAMTINRVFLLENGDI